VGETGLFSAGVRNSVGYCGYIHNEDTGLYTVRHRTYSATLGRWLTRDPAGYVDGMSLFEYVRSAPSLVDPLGLQQQPQPRPQPAPAPSQPGAQPPPDTTKKDPPKDVEVEKNKKKLKPCKLDGKYVELEFNGEQLAGSGCDCKAASGKPVKDSTDDKKKEREFEFDMSKKRQGIKNEGPLPEGEWFIETCEEYSKDSGEPVKKFRARHKDNSGPWGDYNWPITPMPGTDTRNRDGFNIHGGTTWGSAGCVDLRDKDKDFHDFMDRVRKDNKECCYIKIVVKYPKEQVKHSQPTK